jgi:endonuclease G, mitochondrial
LTTVQRVAAATQVPAVNGSAVLTEKKQTFDPDYSARPGYSRTFLQTFNITLPSVVPNRETELWTDYGSDTPYVFRYHHYSLVMNKQRRFAMWTASNIDYNPDVKSDKDRSAFGGEDWTPDPRLPLKYQVQDDDFYKPATKVDRGHVVRREDNCWGTSEKNIAYANADTYHWTNCTPQHEQFNRDAFGISGLWGRLENHIQDQLDLVDNRAILFAGPVLDNVNDPVKTYANGPVQYPLKYWKIVLVNDATDGLTAYGFILDQKDVIDRFGLEGLDFSAFEAQQATIQSITDICGVVFDPQVYAADVLKNQEPILNEGMRRFRTAAQILLRKKGRASATPAVEELSY